MLRGVFVTGTDTGVGKTLVAAALLVRYRGAAKHARVRYWKPIQTGIEQDNDTETVARLASCASGEVFDAGVRLRHPVSPHLAARLNEHPIVPAALVDLIGNQAESDRWIVEGAGGVLVPINESTFMVDFIGSLGLPVVIVARSSLGTINHTLMTLESLRSRSIAVAGVVMSGEPNEENRKAVESFGGVSVLGELPMLNSPAPDAIAAWAATALDPDGRLASLFT